MRESEEKERKEEKKRKSPREEAKRNSKTMRQEQQRFVLSEQLLGPTNKEKTKGNAQLKHTIVARIDRNSFIFSKLFMAAAQYDDDDDERSSARLKEANDCLVSSFTLLVDSSHPLQLLRVQHSSSA